MYFHFYSLPVERSDAYRLISFRTYWIPTTIFNFVDASMFIQRGTSRLEIDYKMYIFGILNKHLGVIIISKYCKSVL